MKRRTKTLVVLLLAVVLTLPVLVYAGTKKSYSKKYYARKVIKKKTEKTTSTYHTYGDKYKYQVTDTHTKETTTVYYHHTKTVSTKAWNSTKKKKRNYDIRKMSLKDIANYVPVNVRNAFEKRGLHILVKPSDYGFQDNKTKGIFSAKRKLIILREYDKDALIHEVGHFVLQVNTADAFKAQVTKAYTKEKACFPGKNADYARSSMKEYFAEAFREYCKGKGDLKKQCPQTFKCVQEAIKNCK